MEDEAVFPDSHQSLERGPEVINSRFGKNLTSQLQRIPAEDEMRNACWQDLLIANIPTSSRASALERIKEFDSALNSNAWQTYSSRHVEQKRQLDESGDLCSFMPMHFKQQPIAEHARPGRLFH